MFSLIISIISIALVAVLALATLYYGGDAFNRGSATAQAAKIINQGQQLLGAAEMFLVDHKRYPHNVTELVNTGYLKHVPVAYEGRGTVAEAWAAAEWEMPTDGAAVFVATVDSAQACAAVNDSVTGADEVLPIAYPDLTTQCYQAADAELLVVVSKDSTALQAVAADDSSAVPGLLPASEISSTPYASGAAGGTGGAVATVFRLLSPVTWTLEPSPYTFDFGVLWQGVSAGEDQAFVFPFIQSDTSEPMTLTMAGDFYAKDFSGCGTGSCSTRVSLDLQTLGPRTGSLTATLPGFDPLVLNLTAEVRKNPLTLAASDLAPTVTYDQALGGEQWLPVRVAVVTDGTWPFETYGNVGAYADDFSTGAFSIDYDNNSPDACRSSWFTPWEQGRTGTVCYVYLKVQTQASDVGTVRTGRVQAAARLLSRKGLWTAHPFDAALQVTTQGSN